MKAFSPSRSIKHIFIFIVALSAGLGLVDVVRSLNFVKAPVLGKSCSQEGPDCTNFPGTHGKLFDFAWSVTDNVHGHNFINVSVLKSSSSDPNDPHNWVGVGQVKFFAPSSNITLNNVFMRSTAFRSVTSTKLMTQQRVPS